MHVIVVAERSCMPRDDRFLSVNVLLFLQINDWRLILAISAGLSCCYFAATAALFTAVSLVVRLVTD